jgi:hypothetical protein
VAQFETLEKLFKESISELELETSTPPPQEESTLDILCEEPQISLHTLLGILSP